MKKHLLLSFSFVLISMFTYAQTAIEGKIIDEETKEGLISAEVILYKNDVFITGTTTDFDGNFALTGLEAGTYDIEAKYIGYQSVRETGVILYNGKTNRVNINLSEGVLMDVVVVKAYKAPLIEQDNTTQGKTVTAEQIRSLPTKSITAIAATSAGLSTTDGDSDISIRGSRGNATNIYVDGIRVSQSSIPASEIDQLQVITGGMEAKYGDVTGGIISITSKGPSQRYTGGFEAETSLDGYGYNLLSGYLSGPILKKKVEGGQDKSILGFRFSGQFRSINDGSPSAVGVYRLPEEQIRDLESNPVGFIGNTEVPRVEFFGDEEFQGVLDTRPNENRTDVNVTAKIDARITDNIDVSLSGGYDKFRDQFTPGGGWALLNWTNNPYSRGDGFRTSLRMRHKIGKQGLGQDEDDAAEGSSGLIRNAYYSVQAGYEKRKTNEEDLRHEDRLFDYGHYGNQGITWEPEATRITNIENYHGMAIEFPDDDPDQPSVFFDHQGDREIPGEFTPSDLNAAVANFNTRNGFTGNPLNSVFNGLHQNVGQVYNRFSKSESDRYTANIALGFDLLPGGSEQGRHSVQVGFNYEYRVNRFYVVAPEGLWTLAQLNANRHIIGVDTNEVIGSFFQEMGDPFGEVEFKQYANLIEDDAEASFYKKIRADRGIGLKEYINVDEIDPSEMRLDFFSAGELNNERLINYYGYDYLGNKLSTSTTFDDFFTSRDDDGVRTFDVAPLKPIYWSAYVQDKFSYKDIIFRLGVRLDYYDANTKVLKTPHSLYDIETASEFFARNTDMEKPDAIGDDYEVYVTGEETNKVKGYRLGDQFFLPNGTEVASGAVLFADNGNVVFPSYVGRFDGTNLDIQSPPNTEDKVDYDPNSSFEDYSPQINVMPRLAFSFPISEDANFFAHYDILVQRPPSGTAGTARSYYYFNTPGRTALDNPNLKPEQTIDYEVGFQQKLTASSAIKVSAYYKELRNMIQRRQYLYIPAPLFSYEAYGNLDFGTVKGFSFQYDLRRTNNIEFTASYTLQFADGTGSNANSSNGLNTRGALRTLIPLSYDERHRLSAVLDYRYGSGKAYNGPQIAGIDVFANAGANLLITTVSGRPYTRFTTPETIQNGEGGGYLGSLNGARLPWTFNIDMRVDKMIGINLGGEGKRKLNANVYLRVANLLDTRNILGVFPVTSDASDDGFLVSNFGQDAIDGINTSGKDLENYLLSYQARLLDPGNFTLPRRIFVGAIFDF